MTKTTYREKLALLNKASEAYYNSGDTILTDHEFDILKQEILEYEDKHKISNLVKKVGVKKGDVKHKFKMYSMQDVFDISAVEKWVKNKPSSGFICMPKFDGASLSLIYENGELVKILTRGDGEVGRDVTHLKHSISNIPLTITESNLNVYGETMIRKDSFAKINEDRELHNKPILKNTRNAVSGALNLDDPEEAKSRNIEFFPWDIKYVNDANVPWSYNDIKTYVDKLHKLKSLKFNITSRLYLCNCIKEILDVYNDMIKSRDKIPYDIDGLVIRVNNLSDFEELGYTDRYPLGNLAFKLPPLEKATKLLDVEWQVGRSGVLTPVALLNPVELNGATVNKCTLHNPDEIERLDLRINDHINIIRSGDVIPKILNVSILHKRGFNKVVIPTNCPSCESSLIRDGAYLKCVNTDCIAKKLARLTHFVSRDAMDIRGLSKQYLEKLLLSDITTISDLYNLEPEQLAATLNGDKIGENVYNAIQASSRDVILAKFIFSLGLSGVGSVTAKRIAKLCSVDFINGECLNRLDGMSKERIEELKLEISELKSEIEKLYTSLQFKDNNILSNSLLDTSVVITGSFTGTTRENITELIESHNGSVKKSVTGKTSFLLVGDGPSTSKIKKAKVLNIPLLTLDELLGVITLNE